MAKSMRNLEGKKHVGYITLVRNIIAGTHYDFLSWQWCQLSRNKTFDRNTKGNCKQSFERQRLYASESRGSIIRRLWTKKLTKQNGKRRFILASAKYRSALLQTCKYPCDTGFSRKEMQSNVSFLLAKEFETPKNARQTVGYILYSSSCIRSCELHANCRSWTSLAKLKYRCHFRQDVSCVWLRALRNAYVCAHIYLQPASIVKTLKRAWFHFVTHVCHLESAVFTWQTPRLNPYQNMCFQPRFLRRFGIVKHNCHIILRKFIFIKRQNKQLDN